MLRTMLVRWQTLVLANRATGRLLLIAKTPLRLL